MKIFLHVLWSVVYLVITFLVTTTFKDSLSFLIIAMLGFFIYILGEMLIKANTRLRWFTRLSFVVIIFIYVKYPKNFSYCNEMGTCRNYVCNGLFITGVGGTASCIFGNLKMINSYNEKDGKILIR
ncbi:MAG TPA: hypothetical protein DEA43_04875 [Candidatus Moranbacteria bacterium]|nr:hypothetical protein [Candidatus Moranbacteria bacterium]HBI34241.1 hypothetical protein [Candidatus Moranbacteria bacterium]HBT46186.1 hypothetical protein [Candidatus Moranbacteria bacterium]